MKVSMLRMLLLYCILVFSTRTTTKGAEKDNIAVNIGVIYDKDGDLGKMGYNCIKMGLYEFYNRHAHYKTRIALHPKPYNSNDSIVGAASAALYLLKYKDVKAIFVPTTSVDADFVIHLGESAQVPVLSYSVTTPCLSSAQCSYSISMVQNESLQFEAISAIVQAFQWKYVIPIYVDDNEYGVGLIPSLDDALQKINARIPFHEPILPTVTDHQISQMLLKLKALQTRCFVVDMPTELASRFFLRANELGMTGLGYVWITTTSIRNELGSLEEGKTEVMEGVVGVQTYVSNTNELKRFKNRWELEYQDIKLNVMGLWAYDAACALARAVEQVADPNSDFKNTKIMSGNTNTNLDSFGLSPVGPEILKALQNSSFSGLAGNFRIVNGQLRSASKYKIINVFHGRNHDVGFWTSEKGLVPYLNSPGKNPPTNSSLKRIIWPGDATSSPKGWEIPASGEKLKVGVPVQTAYKQLVKVTFVEGKHGVLNSTKVTGFCIDIFDAVMKNIGYSPKHYDYIPFAKQDRSSNGTYDDLVQQVFDQNYDVVVGDVTIIANRTKYVDFTLPFTESGVTMVVPVEDDKQSAWVFLKPLTLDLWVATLCAFIFIAFTIWVLEHRTNEEFRGSPSHQVGTSLFYSFSMMVFAHRENVSSNLSRCVVVVWVFVVLVITQSYTASLTSMLTVQQLRPTVTSVDELKNTGAFVGVQNGTFVKDLLIQQGFNASKIIPYSTCEHLDSLLKSTRTKNGRIAAVFDEIPYMKLFLASRSSEYIMLPAMYRTAGFGFAFPIGSPLASEVSRGILSVTEGNEMARLERKWDLQQYNSSNQGNVATSTRLSLGSFLGLFLIVGVATGLALLVFCVQFLHEHRHIWMHSDASVWSRAQKLAEVFQNRDTAAHTVGEKDAQSTQNVVTDQISIDGEDAELHTATPPRPSNYSDTPITEDKECFPVSAGVSPSRLHLGSQFID